MSTRRQFLTVTSAAVLASTLPRNAFASTAEDEVFSNRNLGAYTQGLLTLERFQQLVSSQFRVFLADGSVATLTLAAVTDRTANSASASSKTAAPQPGAAAMCSTGLRNPATPVSSAFDLHFSNSGPALEQKSYTVDHALLGRFAALIVPGQRTNGGGTCSMSFHYLSAAAVATGPVRGGLVSQTRDSSLTIVR